MLMISVGSEESGRSPGPLFTDRPGIPIRGMRAIKIGGISLITSARFLEILGRTATTSTITMTTRHGPISGSAYQGIIGPLCLVYSYIDDEVNAQNKIESAMPTRSPTSGYESDVDQPSIPRRIAPRAHQADSEVRH